MFLVTYGIIVILNFVLIFIYPIKEAFYFILFLALYASLLKVETTQLAIGFGL